ncbi:clustered mitochondria-domain-containing protein [Cryomyces antarcticus]
MAESSNDVSTQASNHIDIPKQHANGDAKQTESVAQGSKDGAVNGETANGESNGDSNAETGEGQAVDNVFQLTIKLPDGKDTQIMVSTQEQVQDIRQSIIDLPSTFQYSCFHLEYDGGKIINDFVELSEVKGLTSESEVRLVEDPYTEKESRIHFVRVRELIGAAGDRTDLLYGIEAGLSLHDSLAEPTAAHSGSANGNSSKVSTNANHPMSGYDVEAPGSYKVLLPPRQETAPKTVKSMQVSHWNPPPYHLRSQGHLLYLLIHPFDTDPLQITAHVSGFYVNKSTQGKFDPSPRSEKNFKAHSLLTLLSQISGAFRERFEALQKFNSQRDPLSAYQLSNAIPASPWLVPPPSIDEDSHQPDITRTQESYLFTGADNTETLRDWNEEFQSTREMPKETVQDRVFRERLTSKLFADYNEAATRGAVLVARGEVAPLNPTEDRDAQIFVYNNVFFSFGADGVETFKTDGGDEAARVATGKDVVGVKAVNQLDVNGIFTPGTVVVDYLGKRIVGQSIVPGIFKQREPGEHQIDYGGVEGKDVVAANEKFTAPFAELSRAMKVKKHAVWDKEGKRHDLEASVETKGLIGTDGRNYVLDLYRITPLDIDWLEQYWKEIPKDGPPGDRAGSYPHRMAVLRPELVDVYWRKKLQDFVQERMDARKQANGSVEPIRESSDETQAQANEKSESNGAADPQQDRADKELPDGEEEPKTNGANEAKTNSVEGTKTDESKTVPTADGEDQKKEPEQHQIDVSDFQWCLNPDVYCGQAPQTDAEREEWERDEKEVRKVCKHLTEKVIPGLIEDLRAGDVGFPMDGQSLSSLLHKRGINMRYLGTIASLANQEEPRLQALKQLAIQEMIARGFKHVASKNLRHLPPPLAGACVAHLLNCLLGAELNDTPSAEMEKSLKELYSNADYEKYDDITPESLRNEVKRQISLRYRYELEGDWIQEGKHLQLLREIALKLGLQLTAREYMFTKTQVATNGTSTTDGLAAPTANGHSAGGSKKNKKRGSDKDSPNRGAVKSAPQMTFHPVDVQNIVPVLKEASPRSVLAEEAMEAGRMSLRQQDKELGQELLLESLSLHEQIYGILHPEVARVYYALSTLYYGLDEKNAAVELARKAVIVSERTLGVDSAETVLSYLNLGLFEHATGNTTVALKYVRHALELWKIVYGTKHPDSITTINNAAVMLQSIKQYKDSRVWFEASLAICKTVSGENHVNTATLLFQLAQALALERDSKGAVAKMREAHRIFEKELGKENVNTKESNLWLEQLVRSAVNVETQARNIQTRKTIATSRAARVGGTRLQPQAAAAQSTAVAGANAEGQQAATAGPSQADKRNLDQLLKYINGEEEKRTTPKKKTANPKRRQGASASSSS